MDRLNTLIELNFDNPAFGNEDICRELGVSRSHLYRVVKEHTQLSTSLYIRHIKLIKAKEWLRSPDMKIAEIAYKLGIDSPQNFSKYFTKEFGLTPTDYRKNHAAVPVAEQAVVPETVEEPVLPPASNRKVTTTRKYLYMGLGLLCLLALGLTAFLLKTKMKSEPGFSENSIAIMPFKNMGSAESDFFSDGLMQQIHSSLGIIPKLKIISTTSSNKYKNSDKLIPQIAKELHVNYIMEGSVLLMNNKIRITLNLINAEDDLSVWTRKYDGEAKDVLAFMTTVSKEVADELDQKLTEATSERLNKVPTKNPEAYREYLQGRELIGSRTKEELEAGLKKFTNAIELDPDFAMAYAYRSTAWYLLGDGGFLDEATQYKMSERDALTAIRLDGTNGLAYANLANIYRDQKKWDPAKTAYEIALKYSPNDAIINYWYGIQLKTLGEMKEAVKYNARAVELDPLFHVINCGYIWTLIYSGELELAKKKLDEGEVLFNDSFVYYWVKGLYYVAKKDYKNAIVNLELSSKMNTRVKVVKYYLAFCKARNGRQDETLAFINSLPATPDNDISRSIAYAGLRDKKQSLYYLQKAADRNVIPMDLKVFPFLDILEGDPQYEAILRKFGL
ncbi:helix-turn-helix domain-containing protein [Emticicia sp. CRIBPO]|uniref:helix-turn-helix domain-containing protein n=1 Tax=Emticicia sp. CRIBPO TaxID=2683258 RepID=UPI001412AFE6|nr:helix-turn-helix domain-containing protein [Emticicia sp. CRIBPO]NBA87708.1 helix-turn-helix domain-containing protein [Emticicia sp. CRIBPO]